MHRDEVETRLRQLGARLRALRQERGLSLPDVERMSGGSLKGVVIGSYERGDRNVTVTRLTEIAALYDVQLTDLLTDIGGERSASSVVEGVLGAAGIEARVTDWHHPASSTRGVTVRLDIHEAQRLASLIQQSAAQVEHRAARGLSMGLR